MSEASRIEKDRQLILSAKEKGAGAKLLAYTKLSGPGWLQSAITLGGGSLAGSLYLGIIGGYEMMWLQPLMMIFGIVMLSAIGYVALSTKQQPFRAINAHVNPVLGWGWAIATLMANLVWAMPQFSLGTAAMEQNLGLISGPNAGFVGAAILFVIAGVVIWFYDSGGWGIKLFELLLKIMVGVVVISFFAVVVAMSMKGDGLAWGKIFAGFVPNPGLLSEPAESLRSFVEGSSLPEYWKEVVVSAQRDRMVAAAATAVGINMTFLLPYSMLKRGWDKDFRGLAIFDLSTGLFIPFLLATSCVVIAASSQFHANPESGLTKFGVAERSANTVKLVPKFKGHLDGVLKKTMDEAAFTKLEEGQKAHDEKVAAKEKSMIAKFAEGESGEKGAKERVAKVKLGDPDLGLGLGPLDKARNGLKEEDKVLASTLIQRDAFALANSLENLAGKGIAQKVFGIGVVGMAISTIIILMLINGFTVCAMLGQPSGGWLHRFGCFLPGITGAFGALYLWGGEAKFYLAVPTSRFGMVLLPIAYITFFFLMNNKSILGPALPKGGKRVFWNVMMLIAIVLACIGAGISILNDSAKIPNTEIRVRDIGLGVVGVLVVLAIAIHFIRPPLKVDHSASEDEGGDGDAGGAGGGESTASA